jgi:hypothetical protein
MIVNALDRETEIIRAPALPLSSDADAHDDTPLLQYERQPDETTAAWVAFQKYRDMGARRSLVAVERLLYPADATTEPRESHAPDSADAPKRRRGCLGRWSRQHDWVARASAWDAFLDHEARISQVEAVRDMNKRHATEARALQAKAIEALRALAAGDLDITAVVRCVVEGSKLERLALGEVTDAVRQVQRSEGKLVVEVVERVVPIRDDLAPLTPPTLPPVTGGADADSVELLVDDVGNPDTGDLSLPDEPPPSMSAKVPA